MCVGDCPVKDRFSNDLPPEIGLSLGDFIYRTSYLHGDARAFKKKKT